MKRINSWLAVKITNGVGTMFCAYLFAIIAIIGFPYSNTTPREVVQWVSQTFIQLTLLSIIMVGQKIQGQKHSETLKHIKKINKHLGIK